MTVTATRPPTKLSISKGKVIPIREELEQLKELNKEQFIMARQGSVINDLLKISPKKDSCNMGEHTDTESFKVKAVDLEIHKVMDITSYFNTPTKQLLDILIIYYNQQGCKERINVHLDDYMTIRGLTDKKSARKKVNEIIEVLCNSFITCKDKRLEETCNINLYNIPLIARSYVKENKNKKSYIKNNIITVEFSEQFSEVIKASQIMPYPLELFNINGNKNPNSFNFLRKIAEHKNMNVGGTNEDIISVKTLLKSAETISTLEEVRKTNRQIDRKIIQPFERDLNALSNVLSWEYRKKGDIPISKKEIEALKYDERLGLVVKINWLNYPDQSEIINKRKERKSKS